MATLRPRSPLWAVAVLLAMGLGSTARSAEPARVPNVVVVITDDQGYGDLGSHGNPVVKTPQLDAFAKQSAWLKNFQVCPVCSPTRSSLLTGLYSYRTGVVDTYLGRSLMRPDATTLAEHLRGAGYRTGLFGKWHLGDNYPLRPEDRGFDETLWSAGGGLSQPSDPPGTDPKTAYFDPVLKQNGKEVKTKGYCTDVFTDAALKFISADSDKPFFAYVAYNAPHAPYQVPEEFAKKYAKRDLGADAFPKTGQPWAGKKLNTDEIANAYAMIENIDTNFGRLMKQLEEKKLAGNTIVLFLTDNGPGGVRWNGGLRNRKGTVYEGGVRVPCYVRYPARVKPHTIDIPLAHIDIAPTLCELCGAKPPTAFDGRSFVRLLTNEPGNWPGRTLFVQWHRGDVPEKFRAFAARGPKYKLVQASGVAPNAKWEPKYELFEMESDPFEEKDLAATHPDQVAQLKREYELWFADVTKKGFNPPPIVIGNEKEKVTRLSRQDWRGPKAGWEPDSIGHWEIELTRDGRYRITILSRKEFDRWGYDLSADTGTKAIRTGRDTEMAKAAKSDSTEIVTGTRKGQLWLYTGPMGEMRGPDWVEVEYLGPEK